MCGGVIDWNELLIFHLIGSSILPVLPYFTFTRCFAEKYKHIIYSFTYRYSYHEYILQ